MKRQVRRGNGVCVLLSKTCQPVLLLQAVINKLVYRRTSEQQYNLAFARLRNPISMTTLTRAPATVVSVRRRKQSDCAVEYPSQRRQLRTTSR